MKVFNLTDIETPALRQRNLMNQSVAVADKMAQPGSFAEVDEDALKRVLAGLQHLVELGVVAIGEAPAAYLAAQKALADKPAKPALVSTATPAADKEAPVDGEATKTERKSK